MLDTGDMLPTMNISTPTSLQETLWMERAACKSADPRLFFPTHLLEDSHADSCSYKKARAICKTCPVINDCLTYALVTFPHHEDDHGMWGGTSPRERRKIKKERRLQRKLVA